VEVRLAILLRSAGERIWAWAERRWALHLKPFFGELRAAQVGSELIARYVDERQSAKAGNATINRELAFLKRAYHLGYRATPPKVYRVPAFPSLAEDNVRKGFLKDEDYERLTAECAKEGLWLRALLAVAYNFGWRKSELLGLRVRQIDLLARTIRLEVGETKNDEGRTVVMTDEVYTLLAACVARKGPDDYVFTRENGQPILDFRKTWTNVCVRACVPGLLLHDLRRTGVRNLRRLGVAESVAMKISGHKTPSIFRRYDITDEADLADAAERLNAKRTKAMPTAPAEFGHSSGIVGTKNGAVAPAPEFN
jgi:integrase